MRPAESPPETEPAHVAVRPPAEVPVAPLPLAGQRRVVSVLYARVGRHPRSPVRMDSESVVEAVSRVHSLLGEAALRYGGEASQAGAGDLVVYFGLSAALEDDAERAVLDALNEALARVTAGIGGYRDSRRGRSCQ